MNSKGKKIMILTGDLTYNAKGMVTVQLCL